MRIEAYSQVQQLYGTKKTAKMQKAGKASVSDELQLSDFGKDFQTAKAAVAASSDIREELTAPLKARIESGAYKVSGESFAERLMQRYEERAF